MKKVTLPIITLLSFIFCTISCNNPITEKNNTIDISPEARSYAEQQFSDANNAFRNLVESKCRSVAPETINPEDSSTWAPADRLEAAAWTGILNDDPKETIKLVKEYGLYDDLMKIIKDYDLENCVQIRNDGARNAARSITTSQINSSSKTGDIFLSHSYDSSHAGASVALLYALTKGYYKHAGVMDKRRTSDYCILSASDENDHFTKGVDEGLGAVGYESKAKWSSSGLAVCLMRVKNVTETQCNNALDYGKQFLGKPYGLTTTRDSNDSFYCSKVVYRCWLSQNRDLEYNTWYYIKGPFVTPQDIYDDSDTTYILGDKPN